MDPDTLCYATLLSEDESTGPSSAGGSNYTGYDDAVFDAFAAYEDGDGFWFLGELWQVNESGGLAWTYYPPDRFKILLYYPETETFVSSTVHEDYAFDSYFTVDLNARSAADLLIAEKSYDHTNELLCLCVRILATFFVEMAAALLFGFRSGKHLGFLAVVNAVTQIVVNGYLNIVEYQNGYFAFWGQFFLGELIVVILEAVCYCRFLKTIDREVYGEAHSRAFYIIYAITANLLSFITGWFCAGIWPDFF